MGVFTFNTIASNSKKHQTHLTKPRPLLTEQGSLGNTPRIHTTKGDAGAIVISPMQFRHGHHIANLAIFVGLGAEEGFPVGHGDGIFGTGGKALEVAQVGLGVDESSSFILFISWI
jgi:hypothetical protein